MEFLSRYMLLGALAAIIPVVIHFFFRSRYRTVPWAAMKFLMTSVEQTSRRLKFQELLLLLLRMAVLVMLAVAFARPITSMVRGAGRGDAVDAVFVFDVSYSMGANEGAKKRLDLAREEALKIIDELPNHSTVRIITCAGNDKKSLGPRSASNLDQAKHLIQNLEIKHLASDLYLGVSEAQVELEQGHASNKEVYIFSDMQKLGFDQQSGELKQTLLDIKEKAAVHLVRCGTRTIKNAAVVGITTQSGIPRPGERVGFAVLVRNTGSEPLENLTVSLAVDGDEKNQETAQIPHLKGHETRAITLTGKLEKAGLRVLTARIKPDDLEGDNRYDQVILVREQVNILVVDGNYNESEPAKSSSFYLMHALLPVKEKERATYHLQPRVVSARLASPALLAKQDICILVNVALQARKEVRAEVLPTDFLNALDPFVRQGRSLIVFGGDNVQPEPYNRLLGKKLGLLPLPLKSAVKAKENQPFLVDRNSFGLASFWMFKEDEHYKDFSRVEIWQTLEMDENVSTDLENLHYGFYKQSWQSLPDFNKLKPDEEGKLTKGLFDLSVRSQNKDFGLVFDGMLVVPESGTYTFYLDSADGSRLSVSGVEVMAHDGLHELSAENDPKKATVELTKGKQPIRLEYFQHSSRPGLSVGWSGPGFARRPLSVSKEDNPLTVVLRLNEGKPLVAAKKVDGGEVLLIGTSADPGNLDEKTWNPTWTDWPYHIGMHLPFIHVMIVHLLHGQSQTYNLVAGQTLNWYPPDKHDNIYNLYPPAEGKDLKPLRLGVPEKFGKRFVVTTTDLPRAGVYHMTSTPRGSETIDSTVSPDLIKNSSPIAVIPDLRDSEDLQTLDDMQIDQQLGFQPIHLIAGDTVGQSSVSDRFNREWTIWVLMAVLGLALCETLLAWWCGRAW